MQFDDFSWFKITLKAYLKDGFSLIELSTTIAIIGVLSVIGIRSYQARTNKARTAEAKNSLSYIWNMEEGFRDSWGTYHENLLVVGAIPSGSYHYDVGFGDNVNFDDNQGSLFEYPTGGTVLNIKECTDFNRICSAECINNIKAEFESLYSGEGSTYSSYFKSGGGANCQITGCKAGTDCVKDGNFPHGIDPKATDGEFKAVARGKLKKMDIWSIDHRRTLRHEADGTE